MSDQIKQLLLIVEKEAITLKQEKSDKKFTYKGILKKMLLIYLICTVPQIKKKFIYLVCLFIFLACIIS